MKTLSMLIAKNTGKQFFNDTNYRPGRQSL